MAALGLKEIDPSRLKPAPRKNTRGDFVVPNSLVENLALLTHAETAFMLIVLRRGGKNEGCVISDRNWQSWTGLKARAKEYAIKGLKEKGLRVLGRGDKAVYSVALSQWQSFVLKATPPEIEKPRTAGRAVSAPPNMKVHPDCASKGCLKLCESCESPGELGENVIQFAQPVAQTNAQPVAQDPAPCSKFLPGVNGAFCISCGFNRSSHKGQVAQPVAQISQRRSRGVAQPVARPKTLQAIRSKGFATAGQPFIELLAKAVINGAGLLPGDDDLAQLIHRATRKKQHSEGMYLSTLPAVVATWLDEQQTAGFPGVTVAEANFDALIVDLRDLARRDPRFALPVDRAIEQLKRQDWNGLNINDCFHIVEKISAEIEQLAIDLYLETDDSKGHEVRIIESSRGMNLNKKQMDSHVRTNLYLYAVDAFGLPVQWIRWIS